ncbi:CBS domain-containing protein [Thalassolituus sp. LLYu03]|uniref:CBS domain-containing protein n=1 Tax=Thalassolituus sp. LLYu03 TaxID=3421656 RepID=UPI003D26E2AF
MKLVSDLMTRELLTLTPSQTLADAEQAMGQHQIRHIPVVNDDGTLAGLLSQKEFLTQAFRITDKFGAHNLQSYLAKTPLSQCMNATPTTVAQNMPLVDAGRHLRQGRHGCLLVTDDQQQLIGLLTSQDFVRLAVLLLEKEG